MNLGYVLAVAGLIATLISIPITFVIARRSHQLPDLRYLIDFDVILDPSDRLFDRGLAMMIGSHSITSISRTRVAFWNHRGDTVRGTDIVDADPIRLEFQGNDSALQVRTLSISRSQNKIAATINPASNSSVDISFDFLDAGDGVVFEVVHQGTKQPSVVGTLRGAKIRNSGHAQLGSSALKAARESRIRRFTKYSSRYTRRNLVFNFVAALIFAVGIVVITVESDSPGHLISPGHFNLQTMTGQANFSNAVQDSGNPYASPYGPLLLVFLVGIVYFITTGITSFYKQTRRAVPKGITLVASDNEED